MLYQNRMVLIKSRMGSGVGLNSATASSIPSRKVRMRILTLTSQASQLRSSKVDCIAIPVASNYQSRAHSVPAAQVDGRAERRRSSRWEAAALREPASLRSIRLPSQLGDHGEQRHVERDHDAADADAQQTDDEGFQHGQHISGR